VVPIHPAVMLRFATLLLALLLHAGASAAPRDAPGDFDFYVLSLSWSPSYCRFADDPDLSQCDLESRGFIVHGLWPQYERGYPSWCPSSLPRRVPAGVVDSIDDIMPSEGLIRHEWEKHGLCAGLYPNEYFSLVRRAFQKVRIPMEFTTATRDRRVNPAAIESAFAAANPGLSPAGMAAICSRGHFAELRICLDKSLNFRRCVEVDRRSCRGAPTLVPAIR
jgi:ribonuclease T2